jgi:hypothetical protein
MTSKETKDKPSYRKSADSSSEGVSSSQNYKILFVGL